MKLKNGKYDCVFCEKQFDSPMEAYAHTVDSHDFVLVPMLKTDISRLLMYIFNPSNQEILPEGLVKRLQDLLRHKKE